MWMDLRWLSSLIDDLFIAFICNMTQRHVTYRRRQQKDFIFQFHFFLIKPPDQFYNRSELPIKYSFLNLLIFH